MAGVKSTQKKQEMFPFINCYSSLFATELE